MHIPSPLLPYFNDRPNGMSIDTIVIHSCWAPNAAEPFLLSASIDLFCQHHVAPHYIIERNGTPHLLVDEFKRAWHAGESAMPFSDDSRSIVNDFSIGIELIGNEFIPFEEAQYETLKLLIVDIKTRHPIKNIVGHHHIAPQRKTDPGVQFSWERLARGLSKLSLRFP